MMMTMTPSDTELYRAHAAEMVRYATVLVGPGDAPDVVTDAVLRAFESPGWRDVRHPRAYLFRAVLNTATSSHRSRSRRARREDVAGRRPSPDPTPSTELRLDVHRALDVLSTQQRAVVYLAYWDDLPAAEIANVLGIGEGSVRKQLARARARLREVIGDA